MQPSKDHAPQLNICTLKKLKLEPRHKFQQSLNQLKPLKENNFHQLQAPR